MPTVSMSGWPRGTPARCGTCIARRPGGRTPARSSRKPARSSWCSTTTTRRTATPTPARLASRSTPGARTTTGSPAERLEQLGEFLRSQGARLSRSIRRCGPGARARAGSARRPRLDRQEHHADPSRRRARSSSSARSLPTWRSARTRPSSWTAAAAAPAASMPVPPMPSCRAQSARRHPLHLLSHHRAEGSHPRRAGRAGSRATPSAATSATTSAPGTSASHRDHALPSSSRDTRWRG